MKGEGRGSKTQASISANVFKHRLNPAAATNKPLNDTDDVHSRTYSDVIAFRH